MRIIDIDRRARPGDRRAFEPTFMYRALASGSADVIPALSSDGRKPDAVRDEIAAL